MYINKHSFDSREEFDRFMDKVIDYYNGEWNLTIQDVADKFNMSHRSTTRYFQERGDVRDYWELSKKELDKRPVILREEKKRLPTLATPIKVQCTICGRDYELTPEELRDDRYHCICSIDSGLYHNLEKTEESLNAKAYFYVVELHDEINDERFYKVGVTGDLRRRIYSMPHAKGDHIAIYTSLYRASQLERISLEAFERFIPTEYFGGHTECILANSLEEVCLVATMRYKSMGL